MDDGQRAMPDCCGSKPRAELVDGHRWTQTPLLPAPKPLRRWEVKWCRGTIQSLQTPPRARGIFLNFEKMALWAIHHHPFTTTMPPNSSNRPPFTARGASLRPAMPLDRHRPTFAPGPRLFQRPLPPMPRPWMTSWERPSAPLALPCMTARAFHSGDDRPSAPGPQPARPRRAATPTPSGDQLQASLQTLSAGRSAPATSSKNSPATASIAAT